MALQSMGIILYSALQTMQPCEKVFADTAIAANPHFKMEEKAYLDEFAKASCATSFPDILWLLAFQETNFRFMIVRENMGVDYRITEGKAAVETLKTLKTANADTLAIRPNQNVDIGVMQFNWRWHGENFQKDPLLALSPTRQVNYFVEKYSRYIYNVCDQSWVGCYHNQTNLVLSGNYQKSITKKTVVLATHSLRFLKEYRGKLNGELLGSLPSIKLVDIRKNFAYLQSFPKPQRKAAETLMIEIAMRSSTQGAAGATITYRK
ncbi:MAG: hypothetical protein EOP10_03415 [Proteobacteria bacterium]|nr:MAG: hypothetical protein EOP10_03415 [Pseudomonadota bacterium]